MGIAVKNKTYLIPNKYILTQTRTRTKIKETTETFVQGVGTRSFDYIELYANSGVSSVVTCNIFTVSMKFFIDKNFTEPTTKTITSVDLFELEDLEIRYLGKSNATGTVYSIPFSQMSQYMSYTMSYAENKLTIVFTLNAYPPNSNGEFGFLGFFARVKYDGAYCLDQPSQTNQSNWSSNICSWSCYKGLNWSSISTTPTKTTSWKTFEDEQESLTPIKNNIQSGDIISRYENSNSFIGLFIKMYTVTGRENTASGDNWVSGIYGKMYDYIAIWETTEKGEIDYA